MLKFLTDLLSAPVTGPVHGFEFILKSIRDQVEAEAFDETKVQGELMQLGLRAQAGEIGEEDYRAQEDALLERLNEIRRYKQSLEEDQEALLAEENPVSSDAATSDEGAGT